MSASGYHGPSPDHPSLWPAGCFQDRFPLPVEYDAGAVERYVRGLEKGWLQFAPGDRFSYNSTGFIVLGDIVAKVSGQTFEEYLQEHIVDPVGMKDTLLIIEESRPGARRQPACAQHAGEVAVTDRFPYRRQFAPTGPLCSSITDMARYAAAHLNRGEFEGSRNLEPTTYDAMWARS